jgi:hypothetical protein
MGFNSGFQRLIRKNEMYNECSTNGGFGGGNFRESDHLEDLGVDGRIILKCMFRELGGP